MTSPRPRGVLLSSTITFLFTDRFLLGILLAGLLVHGTWATYVVATDRPLDYYAYVVASRAFADGENAYLSPPESTAARARRLGIPTEAPPYLYPTLTALVVAPLSFLPSRVGAGIWAGLSVLATLAAGLALCTLGTGRTRRRVFLALLVGFVPVLATLNAGQVNLIVLFSTALFLVRIERRKDWSAGLLLALSIWLKPFALAAVLVLAWRRRWTALGGVLFGSAAILAASVIAFGVEASVAQFGRVAGVVAPAGPRVEPTVQNLSSLVGRACAGWPEGQVHALYLVLCAVVAVVAVVTVLKRREDDAIAGEVILAVTTTLLVSPLTWYHHLVMLLPALAWWTLRTEAARERALVVTLAIAIAATDVHGLAWKKLVPLGPAALAFPAVTACLLWGGLVFALRRGAMRGGPDRL